MVLLGQGQVRVTSKRGFVLWFQGPLLSVPLCLQVLRREWRDNGTQVQILRRSSHV